MAGQHPSFAPHVLASQQALGKYSSRAVQERPSWLTSQNSSKMVQHCPVHCLHREAGGSRCLHGRRGYTLTGRCNAHISNRRWLPVAAWRCHRVAACATRRLDTS